MSEPDDLAGELATVTDAEWRKAHEDLFASLFENRGEPGGAIRADTAEELARQFTYVWAPGEPAGPVDGHDIAPTEWAPGDPDERFEGGGFRGEQG
jgi:hypothetical protein